MMSSNAFENPMERPDFDWVMVWDNLVVFALFLGRDADMRASLSRIPVSQSSKGFD
jgi:hypothetical protein